MLVLLGMVNILSQFGGISYVSFIGGPLVNHLASFLVMFELYFIRIYTCEHS